MERDYSQSNIPLYDQTEETAFHHEAFTACTSFAIDDTLAESVSEGSSPPTMRLWSHSNTIVLGIIDGRLPFLENGVRYLRQQGYNVIIRNSGGLAVALDDGLLNLSLVIPNMKHTSIYEAYEAMVSFVQYTLRDVTKEIKAYEIVGSYCPGDYDLSINGKKFAGISQRRIKDSAAIQIYIDVEGSSQERAGIVKHFYEHGKKDVDTKFTYPNVDPQTMAYLSELLDITLTIDDMKQRVREAMGNLATTITMESFSGKEMEIFERRLKQMKQRNEIISSIQ